MKLKIALTLFLGLVIAACGDDGNEPPDNVDAAPPPPPDPCEIEGPQGTIAPFEAGAVGAISEGPNPNDPDYMRIKAIYTESTPEQLPDWFEVRLYAGATHFPGPITTGTFDVGPDDTQFQTCGVCLMLVGDSGGEGAHYNDKAYLATSGTVTVNSLQPVLDVEISNVQYQRVTIADTVSAPHPSGCTASVTSGTASATVMYIGDTVHEDPDDPTRGRLGQRKR